MPATPYTAKVNAVASPNWAKLFASRLILDATLIVLNTNPSANLKVRMNGTGAGVDWPKGTQVTLLGVDLSKIEIQATTSDAMLIIGNTRPD